MTTDCGARVYRAPQGATLLARRGSPSVGGGWPAGRGVRFISCRLPDVNNTHTHTLDPRFVDDSVTHHTDVGNMSELGHTHTLHMDSVYIAGCIYTTSLCGEV